MGSLCIGGFNENKKKCIRCVLINSGNIKRINETSKNRIYMAQVNFSKAS